MKLAFVLLWLALFGATSAPWIIAQSIPAVSVPAAARPVRPKPVALAPRTPTQLDQLSAAALLGARSSIFRAPTAPADLLAEQRAKNEPDFALTGIMGRGEMRKAVLRSKSSGEITLAGASSQVGDWKVEEVALNCAKVRRGKRTVQLCL